MSRFVSFNAHKLELEGGQHGPEWLMIRDRLSYAEQLHIDTQNWDARLEASEVVIRQDSERYRLARLEAYIVDWQLFDDNGALIAFTPEALKRLDIETGLTVLAHLDALYEAEEAKKKVSPTPTPGKPK